MYNSKAQDIKNRSMYPQNKLTKIGLKTLLYYHYGAYNKSINSEYKTVETINTKPVDT